MIDKKFSVVMMVSRSGKLLKNCVASIKKQNPDEFRAYIDFVVMNARQQKSAMKILKDANAKILDQIFNPMFQLDHHRNMIHNYHRMIMEAKYKWVMYCDDDDEMLGDRREILNKYATDDVGLIYGDKIVKYPNKEPTVWKNKPPSRNTGLPSLNRKNGAVVSGHSGVTYNRDAFRKVHNFLDHSYFVDYKSFYWIIRAGYRLVYVPQSLSFQNVNPYIAPERRAWWGKWDEILDGLNKIPLGIIGTVK